MLYVGSFSYSDANEQFDNICLMPAIVEAPDSATALARFKEMLRDIHDSSDLVDGAHDMYLDSLVELDEAPTTPLVVQWQKITAADDGLYSSLSTLPRNERVAHAYAWGGGDELVELATEDDIEGVLDDVEGLADAIAEAFEALTSDNADDLDDTDEEAFVSFDD